MDILPCVEISGFHARISLLSDIVISWGPSDHWRSVELGGAGGADEAGCLSFCVFPR
jgi:hypothetical protein